jgi:hypothetical protein
MKATEKGSSSKIAERLTEVKPWAGPANVEIHDGSNTHVNQGIDPLDGQHNEKGPNGLWKQHREGKSPNGFPQRKQTTR